MTMYSVPHRTASGSIERSWEYFHDDRRLVVSLAFGANTLTFAVDICAVDRPVFGRVPIRRVDGEKWLIGPERIIRRWPGGVEILEPLKQPITGSLGFGDSIVLCNTPPEVDALLVQL